MAVHNIILWPQSSLEYLALASAFWYCPWSRGFHIGLVWFILSGTQPTVTATLQCNKCKNM